jgi:hypothetical protein
MPVGAIVTLCAIGVALIAFGIILIILGGKPKFFAGKRYEATFNKLKTTFIIGDKLGLSVKGDAGYMAALICSLINDAVREAFAETNKVTNKINSTAWGLTKHIIVQLMDNDTYVNQGGKKYRNYYEHSAACMGRTGRWFWGKHLPTVCIRVRKDGDLTDIINSEGEPLVHELCHAYLNDYSAGKDDHADPQVWIAAGGMTTIQYLARRKAAMSKKVRQGLSF